MTTDEGHGLKVALITPSFPPRIGGVPVHVDGVARGLAAHGCHVEVLTQVGPWGGDAGTEYIDPRLTIHRFRDWTGSSHFPVAPSLRSYLRKHKDRFDIVHAHSFHAWPAWAAANATHSTFVFTPHYHRVGHTALARLLHIGYDPLASRIFRKASVVLCVSTMEADLVKSDYPECKDRISIVPNGVDIDEILDGEPFELDHSVIIAVGRIEQYKQIDHIVDALAYLDQSVRLVVIGDGPARRALESHVAASGHQERVLMAGRLDASELHRWQRTAAVLVSMSRHEAFGLVIIEGVAAGSRIVASDIAAHREVAEMLGNCVDLVPVDAPPDYLARSINEALASPPPEDGLVGFTSWAEVALQVLGHYRRAMTKKAQQ